MQRDENGIPIIDANGVEDLAERFLKKVAPAVLDAPTFTPVGQIADQLQEEGFVRFVFNADLGQSPEGYKYLGCFDILKKVILIAVPFNDVHFPFTVCHELGHFYLHSSLRFGAVGIAETDSRIRDSSRDIVIHRVVQNRPRTIIEWQANRFAAAILIPRATVTQAVSEAQEEMGINRNRGVVILDELQPFSRRDAAVVVNKLHQFYQCSRSVVRFRLEELGIMQARVKKENRPQHIGEIIREMLSR